MTGLGVPLADRRRRPHRARRVRLLIGGRAARPCCRSGFRLPQTTARHAGTSHQIAGLLNHTAAQRVLLPASSAYLRRRWKWRGGWSPRLRRDIRPQSESFREARGARTGSPSSVFVRSLISSRHSQTPSPFSSSMDRVQRHLS